MRHALIRKDATELLSSTYILTTGFFVFHLDMYVCVSYVDKYLHISILCFDENINVRCKLIQTF